MKKNLLILVSALLLSASFSAKAQKNQSDYTVPSWTLYQRALIEAEKVLISNSYPYNVNVVINENPITQMGATWFTNAGITGGVLQLVQGEVTTEGFASARVISANSTEVNDLMYVSTGNNNNDMVAKTGFTKGERRSYVSNKVLIDGLLPNTTYSYRVGGVNDAWSPIGTFITAKDNKDAFEFIYITDTQSNTDEMFDISQKTVDKAFRDIPNAKFLLINGDLIETSGNSNSEWEWEQWFEKMQSTWLQIPIVPVQGNHDTSGNNNMFHHFNTDKSFNALQTNNDAKTAMEGTVYSFVYGDALFMVVNYEDYRKGEPYFAALEQWMEEQVTAHSDVKWKIATYHKTIFTGSNSHQSDSDGRTVRERMAKVYQRLGIDLALQGHDHIYEVIGVMAANETTYSLIDGSITNQTVTEAIGRENMTGKEGGTFDVSNGTLYFLNNSAGRKKYEPRTRQQMENAYRAHGIENYFDMFSKFGQTGEPTFSKVSISTDEINISTYTVNDEGEASLFDYFKVVKPAPSAVAGTTESPITIYPNPANRSITISVPEVIEDVQVFTLSGSKVLSQKSDVIDLSSFIENIYLINVKTTDGKVYTERLVVKK